MNLKCIFLMHKYIVKLELVDEQNNYQKLCCKRCYKEFLFNPWQPHNPKSPWLPIFDQWIKEGKLKIKEANNVYTN